MEGQGMSILDHSSSQLAGGEILLAKKDVHLKNAWSFLFFFFCSIVTHWNIHHHEKMDSDKDELTND